jgi:hypothetical protein
MIIDLGENTPVPCGCGRSSTGFCVGLHSLSDEEYDRYIMEGHVYPGELIKEEKKNES